MLNKRKEIIRRGDLLIRKRGFNAFSFTDIARDLGIRNASIHYYFPTKTSLGVAIIEKHLDELKNDIRLYNPKNPALKLNRLFFLYRYIQDEDELCIVGAIITDLRTLEAPMREALQEYMQTLEHWVTGFLDEGKKRKIFQYETDPRTKALMILSNMMAAVQMAEVTGKNSLVQIQEAIIKELRVNPHPS